MNHLERKRRERVLATYDQYFSRPLHKHALFNLIWWGIFLGPFIYFINHYEKETGIEWSQLLKSIVIFALAGASFYTLSFHSFMKWQRKRIQRRH